MRALLPDPASATYAEACAMSARLVRAPPSDEAAAGEGDWVEAGAAVARRPLRMSMPGGAPNCQGGISLTVRDSREAARRVPCAAPKIAQVEEGADGGKKKKLGW